MGEGRHAFGMSEKALRRQMTDAAWAAAGRGGLRARDLATNSSSLWIVGEHEQPRKYAQR
jgi:hypothetical protein